LTEAFVGLGANLGKRVEALDGALAAIDRLEATRVHAVSRYYRTPPWGRTEQPDFLNAVARVYTGLTAGLLLRRLLQIESELGRERSGRRWGPRVIDLDLLLYADSTVRRPELTLPHPRMHERAFVLIPLLELAPDCAVPGHGRADALLAGLNDNERSGIRPGPLPGFEVTVDHGIRNEMETRR